MIDIEMQAAAHLQRNLIPTRWNRIPTRLNREGFHVIAGHVISRRQFVAELALQFNQEAAPVRAVGLRRVVEVPLGYH